MTQIHLSTAKESFKIALYILTTAACFFFAFWELKLKSQLTAGVAEEDKYVSEYGVVNDLRLRMKREHYLKQLPREKLSKYRLAVTLKFFFVALLVAEVIILQR
jgi:hypothetical protein